MLEGSSLSDCPSSHRSTRNKRSAEQFWNLNLDQNPRIMPSLSLLENGDVVSNKATTTCNDSTHPFLCRLSFFNLPNQVFPCLVSPFLRSTAGSPPARTPTLGLTLGDLQSKASPRQMHPPRFGKFATSRLPQQCSKPDPARA